MIKYFQWFLVILIACVSFNVQAKSLSITSPDKKINLNVAINPQSVLVYSIEHDGQLVVLESQLGLVLSQADFTKDLKITKKTKLKKISDTYQMRVGKKSHIAYTANEQTVEVSNSKKQKMEMVFRVSNDGVAFRYQITDRHISDKNFVKEITSFHFSADSKAWLQPMAIAQSGWSNVNPSYEEEYSMGEAVGTPSVFKQGWVFPGLFHANQNWALISEVGLDGSWHGSHLAHNSENGNYQIAIPQSPEVFTNGGLLATAKDKLISPWRIIAVGSLATIMESTLGTDVAPPAIKLDSSVIKPGHASWSWAILKDDFTTFEVQKKFIDYAAEMHWDYTLIDADWDQKIGYEKLKELVDYAAQKNIGILVWFNSSGDWNETPYTPKSELLTHKQRVAVFTRLRDIGVKGLKIDFFNGDGQSMIAYYVDILKDAAQFNLLINFHGATLPRGWQRTYPHLMTMEAIRGFEFTTFSQKGQDAAPNMVAGSLFTRNVFDPMDFTPMVFGEIPNIKRVTTNSFELAESVLMVSGIQHFAEIPEGMATVPAYVKDFLRELPREWDEVKFVDGYPGKYLVLARRAGNTWYVAGMNAEKEARTINLDLKFLGNKNGVLIENGDTSRNFVQTKINSQSTQELVLKPVAGFVAVFN